MLARATTTISILRGETADAYGDPEPVNTPVLQKVPASIVEKTRTVFNYDSPTPRVIHYHVCRIGAGYSIKSTDVILDESTGVKYALDGTYDNLDNSVYKGDLVLMLKTVA